MENNEIKDQLVKIAESLDTIAESIEKEAQQAEPTTKRDFGFGKVGSSPVKDIDPLTSFLLS